MNFLKEFFVLTRSKSNNISGQCNICGKFYSDTCGSTGNFHKHLKRKHNAEYEQSRFPDSVATKNDITDYPEELTNDIIKINQVILEELIVKCNLPPSIVEYAGFRKFLKTLAPKWKPTSSRYFTKSLLPSLVNNIQDKIKNLLDNIDYLSITVDVWTDRRGRSFIGVTGHFLDMNYIPQALLLNFSRLKGPHTGENIRNITVDILENLKVNKILYYYFTPYKL
jgi:BED zinc finger